MEPAEIWSGAAMTPVGNALATVIVTAAENPPVGMTVTFTFLLCPRLRERLDELRDKLKFGVMGGLDPPLPPPHARVSRLMQNIARSLKEEICIRFVMGGLRNCINEDSDSGMHLIRFLMS